MRGGYWAKSFADNLASGVENAYVMCPITEIKAEGVPAADSSGCGGNEGRCVFCFHKAVSLTPNASTRPERLPSHLIWLGHIVVIMFVVFLLN